MRAGWWMVGAAWVASALAKGGPPGTLPSPAVLARLASLPPGERVVPGPGTEGPEYPGERVRFEQERERSADGHVRPTGLADALAWLGKEKKRESPGAFGPRGARGGQWLGPGNIGGRTRALVIHPSRPDTIWAGSASGGIWKSTDRGRSWQPLDDFLASLAVCALVLDPKDPDTLWAGTGEGFHRRAITRGAGIFRSRDGGRTWSHLPATRGPEFGIVNRLAISADGAVLLAATHQGLRRSLDRGETWAWCGPPVG
ncbi:MAG: hypothetical protein HYZ27_10295, partial [Deltaproteobacteria bacterium]|nr:hypothetical protein [Deltaproteobacteria bacterium]